MGRLRLDGARVAVAVPGLALAIATAVWLAHGGRRQASVRHDHGRFLGIGSAAFLLLLGDVSGWDTKARNLTVYAATLAIALAPWAIFISLGSELVSFLQSAVAFSRAEAHATVLRSGLVWNGARRCGRPTTRSRSCTMCSTCCPWAAWGWPRGGVRGTRKPGLVKRAW